MKQIKIQHFTPANKNSVYIDKKKYSVQLGNGIKKLFTDKKQAVAFLSETNLFLNTKLKELNFILIDVFELYRIAWFYMDNTRTKKQLNLSKIDHKSKNEIQNLFKTFDIIVSRTGSPNSNHFTFLHFNNIIKSLTTILNILLELYESKSHTDKIYKIKFLINQTTNIKSELAGYPNTNNDIRKKLLDIIN